jgi:hypothetical protein
MTPQSPFNSLDFHKEREDYLINALQEQVGCFNCNKPNPSKTCSRCKVSRYCDRECQKTDWKESGVDAGHHKHLCEVYCDNRSEVNGINGAIPICLYSVDFIDEGIFVFHMQERGRLFLEEVNRYQIQQGTKMGLFFQTSVIKLLGNGIRLVAAVSFHADGKHWTVNHVLLETVDDGPEPEKRLYPRSGGPGTIATAAEEEVLEHWVAYIGRVHEIGNASVSGITYGRGLMHVADKRDFQKKLDAANSPKKIMYLPDSRYAFGLL